MTTYTYSSQISSQRPLGMALALVSAIVLSPLYVTRNHENGRDIRWSSGFVLPMVLAGLIIAIKTTSSSSSSSILEDTRIGRKSTIGSSDPSWVLRFGGSSWGLAGLLVLLLLVLSWQDTVQHFFWK